MASRPSEHPVDVLIRRLIASADEQSSAEAIDLIIERMASVTFNSQLQRVPARLRIRFQGHLLGRRTDALRLHLVKRVVEDQQWTPATIADEYLDDIRAAIRSPNARLAVFRRWGRSFAATISDTTVAVPPVRRGNQAEALLFSLYPADAGMIVTAYMISSVDSLRLPEDARWLK